MALIQTAASKFSVVYFVVSALVVYNCIADVVNSKTIEVPCPKNCTCTKDSLNCSNLGLKKIAPTTLAQQVRSFFFSNNKLESLMGVAFPHYHILEYLNLSENEIEEIDPRAFHDLTKLKSIDLSYNNLHYIPPAIFCQNVHLEKVSLKGNKLSYTIDDPPILDSHSITILDLSHCTLTSVNSDTFSQLPKLKVLNLNSNRLRKFNLDILNPLTELSNVDLGNNMWKCDCKVVEVLNMLSNRRKSESMGREHSSIECYEEGKLRPINTAVCTRQAEKGQNTCVESKPEESTSNETSIISTLQELEKKVDRLGITINGENSTTGMKSKPEESTSNETSIISALQELEKKVDRLGITINGANSTTGMKSKPEESTSNETSIISTLQELEKKVDMLGSFSSRVNILLYIVISLCVLIIISFNLCRVGKVCKDYLKKLSCLKTGTGNDGDPAGEPLDPSSK